MHTATTVVLLFAIAAGVALATRAIRVPYTIALVVAGLALGSAEAFSAPPLTQELLYTVFLPGLVFEGSFHLPFRDLWRNKLGIALLAIPGVILSAAFIAGGLDLLGAPLGVAGLVGAPALIFATLISATDPIAVVAIFRRLGAPRRLRVILEGESLVNDGVAVVLYASAVTYATRGAISAGDAALQFVKVVCGSAVVGAAVGAAVSLIIKRINDTLVEITLTTLAAYGSFAAAEELGLSGIIATLVAGVTCGSYGARGMGPETRVSVESFWEYVAFALNSIVFLLIGFEIRIGDLLASWGPIVVAFLLMTLARAAMVFGTLGALRPTRERVPWRWGAVLSWSGLRGALSMVLVLALPGDVAARAPLIRITFGVVLLSLLVKGLTAGPLLRALGIAERAVPEPGETASARRELLAALRGAHEREVLNDEDYARLAKEVGKACGERAAREEDR